MTFPCYMMLTALALSQASLQTVPSVREVTGSGCLDGAIEWPFWSLKQMLCPQRSEVREQQALRSTLARRYLQVWLQGKETGLWA